MTEFDLTPSWSYVADGVMGGVSKGGMTQEIYNGRMACVLRGAVSLENNGGFVQIAFDLNPKGSSFDASAWSGLVLDVCGNDESYDLRLRTSDLIRPWQSFRTGFEATPLWQSKRIPFEAFEPHRTDAEFHASKLKRIGILAIGRACQAEVAIASLRLYRD